MTLMMRSLGGALIASFLLVSPLGVPTAAQGGRLTFNTPEEAVAALAAAAKASSVEQLMALFGPDGQELVSSADPATARRNRDVFMVAYGERWRLADDGANRKTLVIGNEDWPFPVPIVKVGSRWQFDTAAGKEEVLARRIGQNELQAISICHTYVAAQRAYGADGHDSKPAGRFAQVFKSDQGRQNGLYWPDVKGQKHSPLGDLISQAAEEGRTVASGAPNTPSPFYGYYFKILTGQGKHATGGAKSYVVNGEMTGGFALVAWPAQYDATGIMTFLVNQDGTLRQKDLGPKTDTLARAFTVYDPDGTWTPVVER